MGINKQYFIEKMQAQEPQVKIFLMCSKSILGRC